MLEGYNGIPSGKVLSAGTPEPRTSRHAIIPGAGRLRARLSLIGGWLPATGQRSKRSHRAYSPSVPKYVLVLKCRIRCRKLYPMLH